MHSVGERFHLVAFDANLLGDILAANMIIAHGKVAQRRVQHRPALGDVDLLPGEHRLARALKPRRHGE